MNRPSEPIPVAVTGMGAFSAGGRNVAELWKSAFSGRATIQSRELQDGTHLPIYQAPDMEFRNEVPRRLRHADRSVHLALEAAREAWNEAQLSSSSIDPLRMGLVVGSSRGPLGACSAGGGNKPKRPSEAVNTTFSSIAGAVASTLGIKGCAMMVSATCTSGAVAMSVGLQMLRGGALDVVLVGGVDAPLVSSLLEQMSVTGILSRTMGPLKPFDFKQRGTVLGEGAGFLVLETEASAKRRAILNQGWVRHVAIGSEPDARAGLHAAGKTLKRLVQDSLSAASLLPSHIDLILPHGTGTALNDAMETNCIQTLFGEESAQPWSWATKGITGHTLGACPIFQVILALEAMRSAYIPASQPTSEKGYPLRLILGEGVPQSTRRVICLNSGFWGTASSVLLEQAGH